MSNKDMQEVTAEEVGAAATAKRSQERKPNKYMEEWIKILLDSSNARSTDDKAFIDPYCKCRDALVPETNGYELFMYFYCNRVESVPISNPWKHNLEKLIVLDLFVDVDLMKEFIKAYNPVTRGFHRYDGSILCTLDKNSFIEAFGLEGQMSVNIDLKEL